MYTQLQFKNQVYFLPVFFAARCRPKTGCSLDAFVRDFGLQFAYLVHKQFLPSSLDAV